MLDILGRGVGDGGNDIVIARIDELGDKIVLVAQLREHAAGGLDLLDDLGEAVIAEFPVAFPGFQAVQLGGFYLLELRQYLVKIGIVAAQAGNGVGTGDTDAHACLSP